MSHRDEAVWLLKNYLRAAGYTPVDSLAEDDFQAEMENLVDAIISAAVQKSREEVQEQEVTAPVDVTEVKIVKGENMKAILSRVWTNNEFYDEIYAVLVPVSESLIEDVEEKADMVQELRKKDNRIMALAVADQTGYWLRSFPEEELLDEEKEAAFYDGGFTVVEMPDVEAEDFEERYELGHVDAACMQVWTGSVTWEVYDHYSGDSLYTATIRIEDLKEAL